MEFNQSLTIKHLPQETTINGYRYTQIRRDESRAIYAQHVSPDQLPARINYEVFRIKLVRPKEKLAERYATRGKFVDHLPDIAEAFPSDSDFGKTAWTYRTYDEAMGRWCKIQPRTPI